MCEKYYYFDFKNSFFRTTFSNVKQWLHEVDEFSAFEKHKKILVSFFLIKNVSSSTSHKKTLSLRLSLREFKKILPNTFIYESILIIIYMNTNIMNTQIFHLKKYDLKGH